MTTQAITPLRQRMIEDMTIRRLKERTQDFYQRAVTNYAPLARRTRLRARAPIPAAFGPIRVESGLPQPDDVGIALFLQSDHGQARCA